ncbi:MAG: hypothetical protein KY446_11365 [Proteobacteria bacterium]|nr:hypothetical protein [Pseudomonadota bacterium]MBW3618319.1 hypothetical protein [Pseudomonadota bacterium]
MKPMGRAAGALSALALLLAACASITSAPPGPYKVGDALSVTLGREWSDASRAQAGAPRRVRLLTIDGPLLNRLYFASGLRPGEWMVRPARREQPTPVYRSNMSPTELIEFVSDSVAALKYQRVETSGLAPARMGDNDALRFDLKAQTEQGLDMSGSAIVAERGGQLYLILYLAPTEHYFGAGRAEVESIMNSARFSS